MRLWKCEFKNASFWGSYCMYFVVQPSPMDIYGFSWYYTILTRGSHHFTWIIIQLKKYRFVKLIIVAIIKVWNPFWTVKHRWKTCGFSCSHFSWMIWTFNNKNNTKRLDGRLGSFHKTPSITGRYNQLPSQSHACWRLVLSVACGSNSIGKFPGWDIRKNGAVQQNDIWRYMKCISIIHTSIKINDHTWHVVAIIRYIVCFIIFKKENRHPLPIACILKWLMQIPWPTWNRSSNPWWLSISAPHLGSKDFGLKLKSMKIVNGKELLEILTKLPPNCRKKKQIPGDGGVTRCRGRTAMDLKHS